MSIQKFTVSNDPAWYEAWPDVVLADSGKLFCVFSECTHHGNREYTRIMITESGDRGRTWSPKQPLTEGTRGLAYYYNCPRISKLRNGVLAVIFDQIPAAGENNASEQAKNYLLFSRDHGVTWSKPVLTPLNGIVPDKLLELPNNRWIISAHHRHEGKLAQFLRYSDDLGATWSEPVLVAYSPNLNLCEVSLLPVRDNTIVALMRENSALGLDCKKAISYNNGESWSDIIDFPLVGCHRPVAGFLNSGNILITHRFLPGGKGGFGRWTQNLFAGLTDRDSVLSPTRGEASVRILPIDFDRSPHADTGYSGFVQFADGEIYIVNYIVDDAWDKAQIRGYSLRESDFILPQQS